MMLVMDLTGRLALVVGGGEVAGRKVQSLLDAGAQVRVISPEIGAAIAACQVQARQVQAFQDQSQLQVELRDFQAGDTADAWLVVAATGRLEVDSAVATEVQARGSLVCVSGWPELGNVHFPAELRRGPITIGISTNGASPALARRLTRSLAEWVGPEYGHLAELLAGVRARLRTSALPQSERARLFRTLVDGPLLDMLKRGEDEQVQILLAQVLGEYPALDPGSDP